MEYYSNLKFNHLAKLILVSVLTAVLGCQSTPAPRAAEAFYSEAHLDFASWKRDAQCCQAKGRKVAISSGGTHSSQAGLEIHKQGGNLVDVATATAFALAVERPFSLGIGGGGFLTLRWKGKDYFVDFRETAPAKASRDMYLDKAGNPVPDLSTEGGLSVATPGFVAGWAEIHRRWGKLPWRQILEPAIRLAREGFPAYPSLVRGFTNNKETFEKDPYLKSIYLGPSGKPLAVGEIFAQRDLALTLEIIARRGKDPFYNGDLAKKIVKTVKERGGVMDLGDLRKYSVKLRDPIVGKYGDYTYVSAPPPSAGGVILAQTLNVLKGFNLAEEAKSPARYAHLLAETFKRGYADRAVHIGDPDFMKPSHQFMLSEDYAKRLRDQFSWDKARPSAGISAGPFRESADTNQLSVMDDEGNAASSTLTINTTFGSLVAVPGTGVFLNNEMDDFSVKPGEKNAYGLTGSEANAIAPLKRPVSSMTPTILLKDDKPVMAVGGKGGSKIITSVIQVILNDVVVYPGDLKRAVFAPRIHHQWLPDRLELEEGYPEEARRQLESMGHTLGKPAWYAEVQAVHRDPEGNLTAVFDPRDEGGASAQ